MNEIYITYAFMFCKLVTGKFRTWPAWASETCPTCGGPFDRNDKILVKGLDVFHYDCFQGEKPPFPDEWPKWVTR